MYKWAIHSHLNGPEEPKGQVGDKEQWTKDSQLEEDKGGSKVWVLQEEILNKVTRQM